MRSVFLSSRTVFLVCSIFVSFAHPVACFLRCFTLYFSCIFLVNYTLRKQFPNHRVTSRPFFCRHFCVFLLIENCGFLHIFGCHAFLRVTVAFIAAKCYSVVTFCLQWTSCLSKCAYLTIKFRHRSVTVAVINSTLFKSCFCIEQIHNKSNKWNLSLNHVTLLAFMVWIMDTLHIHVNY